ncbi:hypothetical protein [Ekhidna sp.]
MRSFEERLKGGHPNSLGNTIEVVEEVLNDNHHFDELFNCYFSDDELVRLRVSSAVKRVCISKKEMVIPYIDILLKKVSKIDQASTQWTLALLFQMLEDDMNEEQLAESKAILRRNLENHKDWIVLNNSMETLYHWLEKDSQLKQWLQKLLKKLTSDSRKSVSKRAMKLLKKLSEQENT